MKSLRIRPAVALLCAAALGMLLFSAVVAPMLFEALPGQRALAGSIAGRGFVTAYWAAGVAAVASLAVAITSGSPHRGLERGLAGVAVVVAALQLFWISPAILGHGAGWPGSFASLHLVGGLLHLLLAGLAAAIAWWMLDVADR